MTHVLSPPTLFSPSLFFFNPLLPPLFFPSLFLTWVMKTQMSQVKKIIAASKTMRLRKEQLGSKGAWFPPRRPRAAHVPTLPPAFEIAHGTVRDFHHPPRARGSGVGQGGRPQLW